MFHLARKGELTDEIKTTLLMHFYAPGIVMLSTKTHRQPDFKLEEPRAKPNLLNKLGWDKSKTTFVYQTTP